MSRIQGKLHVIIVLRQSKPGVASATLDPQPPQALTHITPGQEQLSLSISYHLFQIDNLTCPPLSSPVYHSYTSFRRQGWDENGKKI